MLSDFHLAACCSCYGDSDKVIGVLVFSGSGYARINKLGKLILEIPTSNEEQILTYL